MSDGIANDLEIDNLPNRLTIFRVLLIPIVITLLLLSDSSYFPEHHSYLRWSAAWIFVMASITDFFDGFIARRRNIVTVLGSFLDPIADKFLTVSLLILLQSLDLIPVIVVIILVLREMYMTSLRLLAMNEGITVPVNQIGKWKTAIQMAGIPFLMINEIWQEIPFPAIGITLIYIACILSLWSAFHYSFNMIQKLKQSRIANRIAKRQNKTEGSTIL